MRRDNNTPHGADKALAGAHPDMMTLARQLVADLPEGATFTAAQLALYLPGYVEDKPSRRGALMRELNRRGYVEHAGYGPRATADDWDAPARVWRRTAKAVAA
ncbi:hypothetical protein [Rhodococcus sp. AH-ZY2]|uniref:hypothetical protein n=1 Tax=Rhodococcus sp. AH-ZY2 TaxID=3047468 RepID=UPI0027DF04F7|nr:hypothetical protein [Rhodococcus sp. AH-ZY2]WML63198.1 hypothetical protein QNA09_25885 [Rhodococcus sp. AH-ZY2]